MSLAAAGSMPSRLARDRIHRKHTANRCHSESTEGEKTTSQTLSTNQQQAPFDPKAIIPTSKSKKSVDQLHKKGTDLLEGVTQYIDGCTREVSFPLNHQVALVSTTEVPSHSGDMITTAPSPTDDAVSSSQHKREPFKAFGIEALPTRALFNDICYDFVSARRWCSRGVQCYRIHPRNRDAYVLAAIQESVRYSRMRRDQRETFLKREPPIAPPPTQPLTPLLTTSQPNSSTLPDRPTPDIRVKLPAVSGVPPSAAVQASCIDLTAHLRKDLSSSRTKEPLPSTHAGNSIDDVENWDTVEGVYSSRSDSDSFTHSLDPTNDSDWNIWGNVTPSWHTTDGEVLSKEDDRWSDSNETSDSHCQSPQTRRLPDRPHSLDTQQSQKSQSIQLRHRRLWNGEVCNNWLRGRCSKGYSCYYIHGDLEYDDDSVVARKPVPEGLMSRTLHQHIRATFGSGVCVTDVATGFESNSVSISGLSDVSGADIHTLLKPFGEVTEVRKIDHIQPPSFKAFFSKTSEAFAALTSLHGNTYFGCKPSVKPGEVNANRLVIRGNAVRFEWDAPCRDVYMGYANQMLADMAIEEARSKPYEDFMTVADIHVGIPAVGAVTVRFRYLPTSVDQDKMKRFGPHQGMVTAKVNFTCSPQSMIKGFRKALFSSTSAQITDLDIRHPPYRDGKMRAWAVFTNSADAQAAAKAMNGVSPPAMGGTKVSAFYVKSISFSLRRDKFQLVKDDIYALQNQLQQENKGYWLNMLEKGFGASIRISGDDIKVLGRLKAEFERILNGEQLYDEGRVIWDPWFTRQSGLDYLEDLKRDYPGIIIEVMRSRHMIRLWGVAEKRALVRRRIVDMVKKRGTRAPHALRLRADVSSAFRKDERDGFAALEALLGVGNVSLDPWENRLVVYGDLKAFRVAEDAVDSFTQRYQGPKNQSWAGGTCPACFTLASLPMKLPCGHSWCRSCLQRYLKVAMESDVSFPLKCHGIDKGCGTAIPLLTARDVLSAEDFEVVLKSAFSSHVHSHPEEFHYCPTPDCHQIYRSTPEGIVMQCPECLSQICTHCHSEAHEGLTCEEVRDGDDSFRHWASQHDVKRCPKCKVAIEKLEGCNHLTCAMCHTHICWVCLQTFENGLVIYGHMQSEHGGSGI